MTEIADDGAAAQAGAPTDQETQAPEQFQVPPDAIARWAALEEGVPLKITLTREDLDHLLLGLRSLAIGQSELVTALTGHINQDAQASARALLTADQMCVAAYNRINAFITVLMMAATPKGESPDQP
ncbi:hypothetical protein [Xanthobacter agilis]|uniref:Uncharacterized protein n=1 Tax=Xanthobacter agilis TaxID=47492 RepID=A0ABU0LA97_XANAG|nr:hypothetical protein [Xanthobacter agilis]MDQ0504041.1 hypothetical protein [Xanthobacter agilis]